MSVHLRVTTVSVICLNHATYFVMLEFAWFEGGEGRGAEWDGTWGGGEGTQDGVTGDHPTGASATLRSGAVKVYLSSVWPCSVGGSNPNYCLLLGLTRSFNGSAHRQGKTPPTMQCRTFPPFKM